MKALTFIATTIIVSAAGVAAGMLFAPEKGSKTRRDISRKSHKYSDYLSDKLDDIISSGSDYMDDFEDKTGKLTNKVKAKAKKIEAKVNSK
jgi:gas vesicle protein